MSPRIVLFGATGYTGRLTAHALSRADLPADALVLAGRSRERLARVADELPARTGRRPSTTVADASHAAQVRDLLGPGDVLVSTVGPFLRLGTPAVAAACDAGAAYLDSTGEPPFLLRVHEEFGPRAAVTGARLLPAFGYDFVPGNLAGALALRDAGDGATGVAIGYFTSGGARGARSASGGTLASLAGVALRPGPVWKDGALGTERPAARVRTFRVRGRNRPAVSIGSSEHLYLPRSFPALRTVEVMLGWGGRLSRLAQIGSAVAFTAGHVPFARAGAGAAAGAVGPLLARALPSSAGGPSEATRQHMRTLVVAEASAADGTLLARVVMDGPSPYDLTAELLAWGAVGAREGRLLGAGALGPVDGFGLATLEQGCADLELTRTAD